MILLLVSITFIVLLPVWFVTDVRRSIRPEGRSPVRPTNIEMVVKKYMRRDVFDRTSTIAFLMEIDELEDPFAESQPKPPPRPSDAATSARPPGLPRPPKKTDALSIGNMAREKIARAYAMPERLMDNRCVRCDSSYYSEGSYGLCILCSHDRLPRKRNFLLVDQYGGQYGIFYSKDRAVQFVHERMLGDISRSLSKTKMDAIRPLDAPYPIARELLPAKTIHG